MQSSPSFFNRSDQEKEKDLDHHQQGQSSEMEQLFPTTIINNNNNNNDNDNESHNQHQNQNQNQNHNTTPTTSTSFTKCPSPLSSPTELFPSSFVQLEFPIRNTPTTQPTPTENIPEIDALYLHSFSLTRQQPFSLQSILNEESLSLPPIMKDHKHSPPSSEEKERGFTSGQSPKKDSEPQGNKRKKPDVTRENEETKEHTPPKSRGSSPKSSTNSPPPPSLYSPPSPFFSLSALARRPWVDNWNTARNLAVRYLTEARQMALDSGLPLQSIRQLPRQLSVRTGTKGHIGFRQAEMLLAVQFLKTAGLVETSTKKGTTIRDPGYTIEDLLVISKQVTMPSDNLEGPVYNNSLPHKSMASALPLPANSPPKSGQSFSFKTHGKQQQPQAQTQSSYKEESLSHEHEHEHNSSSYPLYFQSPYLHSISQTTHTTHLTYPLLQSAASSSHFRESAGTMSPPHSTPPYHSVYNSPSSHHHYSHISPYSTHRLSPPTSDYKAHIHQQHEHHHQHQHSYPYQHHHEHEHVLNESSFPLHHEYDYSHESLHHAHKMHHSLPLPYPISIDSPNSPPLHNPFEQMSPSNIQEENLKRPSLGSSGFVKSYNNMRKKSIDDQELSITGWKDSINNNNNNSNNPFFGSQGYHPTASTTTSASSYNSDNTRHRSYDEGLSSQPPFKKPNSYSHTDLSTPFPPPNL